MITSDGLGSHSPTCGWSVSSVGRWGRYGRISIFLIRDTKRNLTLLHLIFPKNNEECWLYFTPAKMPGTDLIPIIDRILKEDTGDMLKRVEREGLTRPPLTWVHPAIHDFFVMIRIYELARGYKMGGYNLHYKYCKNCNEPFYPNAGNQARCDVWCNK